jgi:hypothetical protein
MMLFFLTVDMIIPLLIVGLGLVCLAKTVSSAFRIIVFTELPVTHAAFPRFNVRDETGRICPDIFPLFGAGTGADTALRIVPATERFVSCSIEPFQLGEKKLWVKCVKVRWANKC